MYIKVENNQVTGGPTTVPNTLTLADGSVITNAGSLSEAELIEQGYYPLVDISLVVELAYHTFVSRDYVIEADRVTMQNNHVMLGLDEYKARKIAAAYQAANNQLDSLVQGYSQLEVATWPMIQADVLAYTATAVVGSYMQAAIDTSGYTAQGLADLLLPRFAEQAAIMATRKTAVEAIMLAADHAAVKAVTSL